MEPQNERSGSLHRDGGDMGAATKGGAPPSFLRMLQQKVKFYPINSAAFFQDAIVSLDNRPTANGRTESRLLRAMGIGRIGQGQPGRTPQGGQWRLGGD